MFKEKLKLKLQEMEEGDSVLVKNDKYTIEFKMFKIQNVEFLSVSGAAVTLLTFFKHTIEQDIDFIMDTIGIQVFKGIDLDIEESKFI